MNYNIAKYKQISKYPDIHISIYPYLTSTMFIIMNTILDYVPRLDLGLNLDNTIATLSTKINENLTMIKNIIDSNESIDIYLVNIMSSVVIVVVSYMCVLYFDNRNHKAQSILNTADTSNTSNTSNTIKKIGDNNDTFVDNSVKHKVIIVKSVYPRKGLYLESIMELNDKVNLENIKMGSVYSVLLRVQMKMPFHIGQVDYELHGNHTNLEKGITRDMYMSFNICFSNITKQDKINKYDMGKNILNIMNYFNTNGNEYCKTNDFIIIAIGENINKEAMTLDIGNDIGVNNVEFYNALISKGYNMQNYYDFRLIMNEKFKISKNFNLMLPIHEVYDIFMDVYNNSLFETKKYVMDDNNFESWNDVSINDIKL